MRSVFLMPSDDMRPDLLVREQYLRKGGQVS